MVILFMEFWYVCLKEKGYFKKNGHSRINMSYNEKYWR